MLPFLRSGAWDCDISLARKLCAACRFKKCMDIGMREDFLTVCQMSFTICFHFQAIQWLLSFHFQGKRKNQSQLTRESYPTPGKPQSILRPDPCSDGPVYLVAGDPEPMVIQGTGGAAGAEQLCRNNYSQTFVSQNSVIRWAPSCMNQNNQNFCMSPASIYQNNMRASYANRHDFENIRSIQDTNLFREAFGLLSDYWIFKVHKNQIFINYKVRTTLKIL